MERITGKSAKYVPDTDLKNAVGRTILYLIAPPSLAFTNSFSNSSFAFWNYVMKKNSLYKNKIIIICIKLTQQRESRNEVCPKGIIPGNLTDPF